MKKITYFTSQQIASGVYRITDISMTKMYLVICTEKAAVLDAGIGYGNLHEYVRTITDKPLIVLISHGHLDHAMGTGAFPGDVYMNHNDIKICIAHQDVEKRYQYSRAMNFMRGLKAITEPLRKEEYLEFMKLLKQQADGRYDQILLRHGIDPNMHPEHGPIQPIGIIEGAIWLCNAILNGKDDHVPTKAMDRIGYSAKGGNAV